MISVAGITQEKTAKIIPNAVGVTTIEEETHMFSSLISREATFKVNNFSSGWLTSVGDPATLSPAPDSRFSAPSTSLKDLVP